MPNKVTRTHNGLMTAMERNVIGKADKQAKQFAKDMASVPHVRIDWIDEHTVPKVWVDGKRVDQLPKAGLVDLHLNYSTKRADREAINCLSVDWLEHAPHGYKQGHIKENSYV